MNVRTQLAWSIAIVIAIASCSRQKKAAGTDGAGTGSTVATPAPPRPAPPPAKPLPPLVADPGGAKGDVMTAVRLGGTGGDLVRALTMAPDGGVLVAGYFEDASTFGAIARTAAGKSDAFVAKLGADGGFAWVATVGGVNDETANSVAVSPDGTVGFAGLFSKDVTFGADTIAAIGSDDAYVAAVDATGKPRWIWSAGGLDSDEVTALAATPDGGFVAAVSWIGKATFGTTTYAALGYDDAALVKLSATGQVEWVTPMQGDGSEAIRRLAVDGNGNIYALGVFQQTIDLGGGPLTSAGAMDLVIARFDASGRHVWSQRVGNPWNEVAGGIAVDRAGDLVIIGTFDRDVDFLGTPLVAGGESDVFVARLTAAGKLVWVKRYGSTREDIGYGVAIDDAGNAIVTGWFQSPIDFGGGPLKSKGQKDGFVAKLGVDGAHQWSRRFGDWDHDNGAAVAVAGDGSIWLAGLYRYDLDLTTPPLASVQVPAVKIAKSDGFVAHLTR